MKVNNEEFEILCERFKKNKESLGFSCVATLKENNKITLKLNKVPKQYNEAANTLVVELYSKFFQYVVYWMNENFIVADVDKEIKKNEINNLLEKSRIVLLNTFFDGNLPALQQKLKECCGKLQLQYELNHLELDADGTWVTWEGKRLDVPTDMILSGEDSIAMGLAERKR